MPEAVNGIEPEIGTPIKSKSKNKRNKNRASQTQEKTRQTPKAIRSYPIITLEKCLIIAQKIKELNGGNPWEPKEVANAIGIRAKTKLWYYTSSSRDFGITEGTSSAKEISLTPLGRSIVYAPNPAEERKKKIEAFLKIDIFKKVLEYYKGSSLPEMKYLGNTLENQFKLHPSLHEEFSKIFSENVQELKIQSANPLNEGNGIISERTSTIIVGETKK